ncbi:MAG: NB-ARC domain-containing protein [Methylosarcina sp.]
MAEQSHSGFGDNVAGSQTKIERQANLGDRSTYIEKQVNYGDRKIPHHLTPPPFIPEIFEGRTHDLEEVRRKLTEENSFLLLVNGEGGIGKTTLAAKYWQRYEPEYNHTAWLFAQKNLLDALLTLAAPLQTEFPEAMPPNERLAVLLTAMANLKKPCLLIIDNVNYVPELEKHYLALRSCSNFHILLTTRINRFEHADIYHINPLQENDALIVFRKHYPKHKKDEDELLKRIFSAVGRNTLVMELLAKNLAAINTDEVFYSLSDLHEDLQKKGLLKLSQTEAVPFTEKGSKPALKKAKPKDIIEALYDEMEMVTPLTEEEQRLLSNLAVLPAENLSYGILKTLLTPEDAKAFSRQLTGLAQRGWIEKSERENPSFYKISPVVQEITRLKNKDNLLVHCGMLIDNLIEKLKYQYGIGHFLNATYEEAALFSRYAESLAAYFKKADYNLSLLFDRLGYYHKTIGDLTKALRYFEDYSRLSREFLNNDPENEVYKNGVAISCERLGTTHSSRGDWEQALDYYQEFHRLEKELHDSYPGNVEFKNNWAISCQYLGITHSSRGDLEQALGYYQEYHRLEKELYEAYPGNVEFKNNWAISYVKLGWTYENLENKEQAKICYKQSKALLKQLVKSSPLHVEFKKNLAWVEGRLSEL